MSNKPQRLTKKQKRLLNNGNFEVYNNFQLLDIIPLTVNQRKTFEAFHAGKNLFLHGVAGTGKTFISIYLSLKELEKQNYERIIIYRSTVPSRDMGFLPGNVREKTRVYESPYQGIFQRLYNRGDAYEVLKQKGLVEFESTAYIRGITIDDAVVIVDESQNLNWQEIYSIVTRMGNNCRIIICGDYRQTDLTKEQSGILKLSQIIKRMDEFAPVEFEIEDIVRSPFVKKFIMACYAEGM